jgi:hypothetical protein
MKTSNLLIFAILVSTIFVSCTKYTIEPEKTGQTNQFGFQITDSLVSPTTETPNFKVSEINLMPNAGGYDATDWVDRNNDKVGDGWKKDYHFISSESVTSILTSPLYNGRYQTIYNISQFALYSSLIYAPYSLYCLSFKYYSTCPVSLVVRYTEQCGWKIATLPRVTKPTYVSFVFRCNVVQVMFYNSPVSSGYLEIDEVNLIKRNPLP